MKKEIVTSICDVCHTTYQEEYQPKKKTTLPHNWIHLLVFDESKRELAGVDTCPSCSRAVMDAVRLLIA